MYKKGLSRKTKMAAYEEAAKIIKKSMENIGGTEATLDMFLGPEAKGPKTFKCAVLMPSYDCNDIRVFKKFFSKDTKFIVVENFKSVPASRKNFEANFYAKLEENGLGGAKVCFYYGNLESLQLAAELYNINDDVPGLKADFVFLDFCSSYIPEKISYFMWANRKFIANQNENGYILVSKALQPRGETYKIHEDVLKRVRESKEYDQDIGIVTIQGKTKNRLGARMEELTRYAHFQVSHLVNNHVKDRKEMKMFTPIVYNGGSQEKTKMGLFITRNICEGEKDQVRHEYFESLSAPESSKEYNEFLEEKAAKPRAKRKVVEHWTTADIDLFNKPIDMEQEIDYSKMLKYLFQNKRDINNRRFKRDRILMKIQAVCPWEFPPETHELTHKGGTMVYERAERIYTTRFIGQQVEWRGRRFEFGMEPSPQKNREDVPVVYLINPNGTKTRLNASSKIFNEPQSNDNGDYLLF